MTLQDRVNALQAAAGATPLELELLRAPVLTAGPHQTPHGGVNQTYKVLLTTGTVAFFKRFAGQSPNLAAQFGHHFVEVPTHEVVAWRLAHALGPPWDELVPTAVLRTINGEGGALISQQPG